MSDTLPAKIAPARPADRRPETDPGELSRLLPGDSHMATLMRTHDWSTTPLGPPHLWPGALRSVVGLLLESQVAMFAAWGPDLGFLYNDRYAEILGAKHPRALGRRFHDVWPEIWSDILPLIEAAMAGRSIYREDLPLVMNRQGHDEQTWFTFSYSPVRADDGSVAGMFCAVWETTGKVMAERALRESETRLWALTRATSNVTYRMNADWSALLWLDGQGFLADAHDNNAGWSESYLHPDDRAEVIAAVRRAIEAKSVFELEHRVVRIDGTLGWAHSRAVPVLDADGRITEWFGAASDVTARHEAQAALRESNRTLERRVAEAIAERQVLADIVASTDAIVQVIDRQGRWLAFNRAASETLVRLYGIEPRLGANYFDLLRTLPEQHAEVTAVWNRALGGEEFTLVGEFGDPARGRRAFEARFNSLRDANGALIGAYQFSDDVTERLAEQKRLREAEASLRHAQKLESLGQLTGGVAHDFNNLLQVLSNGVALVEARAGHDANRRTIEGMKRALKRGNDLTRHLLAFSRRQPMSSAPIDLSSHLLGMRDLLSRSLSGDLDVTMDLEHGLWPVEADASELELAVLNLCVNARDAMPGGGTVTIRARNFPDAAAGDKRGDFVQIGVVDSGTGMSPDVQARAFEPFFTTKETGKGSGLGLAQVYGFAAQSGGEVSIDSGERRGTIVTLLLPRASAPPAPMAEPATPPATSAPRLRGRVLLVEDDADVASVTAEVLRELGLEVAHAGTAAAALDALHADEAAVDIVLSDVMMPGGMSGVGLAGELRRLHPGLPVVLMTGYEVSARDARAQGVPVLLKPCDAGDVAEALATQLGRRG